MTKFSLDIELRSYRPLRKKIVNRVLCIEILAKPLGVKMKGTGTQRKVIFLQCGRGLPANGGVIADLARHCRPHAVAGEKRGEFIETGVGRTARPD